MVYESDFYTTRRPYSTRPSYSTYTTSTPRHYVVTEGPERSYKSAEQVYSYSYNSDSNRYGTPSSRNYSSSESVTRSSAGGPGSYNYTSERTSRTRGDGPGGYNSSYSSTTSGRLPGGTTYRHYSYRGVPSRQVRVLPGLGKVHVTYTYDRLVPYVGHKRLTVVTSPPKVWGTRPSVLQREFDRIENKLRPWSGYSATNRYLNSDSAVRTYYVNYPITGSDHYNLNLPSSTHLPRLYRWYYSWPREYRSYWPYARTYLSNYLRNYYQNSYLPSYYWSSYLPWYRNLDYDFNELENKIDNLRTRNNLYWTDTIAAW